MVVRVLVGERGQQGSHTTGFAAIIATVALALIAPHGSAPAVGSASTSTSPLNTVYRGDQIVPFLEAAAQRRVDIAGIGDSNQIADGDFGHDHGFQKAWSDIYGMYAGEVTPADAAGGFAVMGEYANAGAPSSIGSNRPQPAHPVRQSYRSVQVRPETPASSPPARPRPTAPRCT